MTTYPDDEDGAVLADLAAQGVDMSQPLEIEFPVAAPDEASANSIGAAVTKAGYESQTEYDEGEPDENGEIDPDDEEFGPSWTVYVTVTMIPEYKEIMRIQADLDRLAGPFGGHSDGWGVMFDGGDDDGGEDLEDLD
jgi:regulator of RNase E activity RraB